MSVRAMPSPTSAKLAHGESRFAETRRQLREFHIKPLVGRDMLTRPSGPRGGRNLVAGFLFKLETADGAPAEPPTLTSAVSIWRAGDPIPLGRRTLRVVRVRDDD